MAVGPSATERMTAGQGFVVEQFETVLRFHDKKAAAADVGNRSVGSWCDGGGAGCAARAKGAKPSALLGRSYARRCWAAVAASALAAERGAGDEARAAAAERFLAVFARELADDASLA